MNAVSRIFTLSVWVAELAALSVWPFSKSQLLHRVPGATHMKQEIYLYLCFRLKTMQAGLSAETGLGQCAVCENTQDQKQGD